MSKVRLKLIDLRDKLSGILTRFGVRSWLHFFLKWTMTTRIIVLPLLITQLVLISRRYCCSRGGLMVAEILGGFWTGSLALLADSGHMAVDTAAVALALFALWVSKRPASAARTYGYYLTEILAALLNGVLLVLVSLWILYEAWARMENAHAINGEWMTVIASGGSAVNILAFWMVQSHAGIEFKFKSSGVALAL